MQLQLSNLVDLALGKPHYLNCDQFNLLHTFFHILLIKLNLEDVKIELEGEFASRIEQLSEFIPKDTTMKVKEVRCYIAKLRDRNKIYFQSLQFQVSSDGTKVRRRKAKQISPRHSLMQINRKWIKCCPAQENAVGSPKPVSSNDSSTDINFIEIISHEEEKKILNEKIMKLETELAEMKHFLDIQTEANLKAKSALDEFYQLKTKCENVFPTVEKLCDEQKKLSMTIEERKQKENFKETPRQISNNSLNAKVNNSIVNLLGDSKSDIRSLDSISKASTLSPNSSSRSSTCEKEFENQENCENDQNYENQNSDDHSKKNVCFDFNTHFPCEGFQLGNSEEIYVAGDHQNNFTCSQDNRNVNFWIQKLSHEISVKPNRCEFEMIKAQLFHLIRNVSKIKQIQNASSGIIGPFIKVTNRGVSRGTADKFNSSKYSVPRLSELKNGNQCFAENKIYQRSAAGSHTRIYRANQVRNSRYTRLVTPVKICSSLLICRNRFRS